MRKFTVEVVIRNKPAARDPEGETIQRALIDKGGYQNVKRVRSGKCLEIETEAASRKEAERLILEMCNALRVYNPLVHTCRIEVRSAE